MIWFFKALLLSLIKNNDNDSQILSLICIQYLRDEFNFWIVLGTMNTSGLLQSKLSPKGFKSTLQETRSIHDSIKLPKI